MQHSGRQLHRARLRAALILPVVLAATGCNVVRNGWLDLTVVGNFEETRTMEIRSSLTLEDMPYGVPGAMLPVPEDLLVKPVEYPIAAGDTIAIEIFELRQRQIPYQAQLVVSSTGYVNLPVVGRIQAAGHTVPEFERALVARLQERDILVDPQVTVQPVFLQNATYSIFGVGVSAANDAPLRAGTFPIRRPDLTLLDAINQVGGLNEFVTNVYVFRSDTPPWEAYPQTPPLEPDEIDRIDSEPQELEPGVDADGSTDGTNGGDQPPPQEPHAQDRPVAPEEELMEAVPSPATEPPDDAGADEPPPDDQRQEETAEELEPGPTDPYIWVNGQFVPNPEYHESPEPPARTAPPSFDTATPAVNWARVAGDTAFRVIRVPADMLRTGERDMNIIIRAGDVIRIVSGEIGVYYVMGQVNRVGAFAFNAEPITLKAAIAAAGGLSQLAWPDRCTVYRRIGQREQMIQVDLDRIFAGKDADFYIRRGDIINVGTHPFAPFLRSLRGLTIPNPVSNAGYSFTYARNFADIDSFAVQQNPNNEPDRFPLLFP